MSVEDILAEMKSRFSSLNAIPVERASIRAEEWQKIEDFIRQLQAIGQHYYFIMQCMYDGIQIGVAKGVLSPSPPMPQCFESHLGPHTDHSHKAAALLLDEMLKKLSTH